MGEIVSSRLAENGKVILEVHMNYDEALELGGHMEGVHVFSNAQNGLPSRLTRRGKDTGTTYLLIPKKFRKQVLEKVKCAEATCSLIENDSHIFLVFSLEKDGHFNVHQKSKKK